ncbi:MAG: helix-turn-helix domain-containing protein [Archangium sp.]|nr:helix-turn-helix domain-containing protein [Archangium sp.]
MNRWTVVIGTPGKTWSVELHGGRTAVVGQGKGSTLEIADAGLAERHLSLLPRDEGVLVEPLRGGGEVLVNDVPASAQSLLHSGDELRVGDARLLFTMVPPSPLPRARMTGPEEWMSRLEEEVRRAGIARPLGVALVSSPGINVAARQALVRRVVDEVQRTGNPATARLEGNTACFGELTAEVLAVLLPEVPAPALATLFARLPEVAGPRAAVAVARAPEDGLDAETLLGACWDTLLGEGADRGEPVYVDPSMIRLAGLLESLTADEGAVCVFGGPGSGRRTLLEGLARAAGRRLSVFSALDTAALTRAASRSGDWVLARDVDRLEAPALRELAGRVKTRLLATATRPPHGNHFLHLIEVPPLSARREDVLPLAEAFVSRARVAVGRPRLTLSAEAKTMLQAWRWPGNVRELANVLARAARAAVRDEIGRDALPSRLSIEAPADDFRGAMESAERDLLLETLARTRWNVSAAATRLGMPRRTIVHRMAKLGLKRPAR